MLLVLPIVFIPFIINFPVGLILYWMTTNLWTVGQGLVTRRLMPQARGAARSARSRTPPKEAGDGDGGGAEPAPAPAEAARQPRAGQAEEEGGARR